MNYGGEICRIHNSLFLIHNSSVKIAIVADWLTTYAGAEHVLLDIVRTFPQTPIFTTVAKPRSLGPLFGADIRPTRLQRLYRMVRRHQLLLPFLPRAVESIDLRGFDCILSSSHAVGKGVVPPSGAVHVCYCHTPVRYAWEMEEKYLEDFRVPQMLRPSARRVLKRLRRWDLSTAKRVDLFLANSRETAARIENIYGRPSVVLPPPVDDRFFASSLQPMTARTRFLAVGRLVPYKRFDLLVEASNALGFPLTIVGRGQERARLKHMAGPSVEFVGHVPDADLPALYATARAVLFPQHEDAGIVAREAQAAGTPVIAFGRGGVRDAVEDGVTGLFFEEQTVPSLAAALERFAAMRFDPTRIREHARAFGGAAFRTLLRDQVTQAYASLHARAPR